MSQMPNQMPVMTDDQFRVMYDKMKANHDLKAMTTANTAAAHLAETQARRIKELADAGYTSRGLITRNTLLYGLTFLAACVIVPTVQNLVKGEPVSHIVLGGGCVAVFGAMALFAAYLGTEF